MTAKRCAAICGLLLALAGCGTPASPPTAATGAPTGRETARSASPSPTGCEDPCTTTRTDDDGDCACFCPECFSPVLGCHCPNCYCHPH
jgi:hypothetical protein